MLGAYLDIGRDWFVLLEGAPSPVIPLTFDVRLEVEFAVKDGGREDLR